MPTGLREHIRYPVRVVLHPDPRVYLRYHVTDPQVFFNEAEQWAIPLETRIQPRPGWRWCPPTYS